MIERLEPSAPPTTYLQKRNRDWWFESNHQQSMINPSYLRNHPLSSHSIFVVVLFKLLPQLLYTLNPLLKCCCLSGSRSIFFIFPLNQFLKFKGSMIIKQISIHTPAVLGSMKITFQKFGFCHFQSNLIFILRPLLSISNNLSERPQMCSYQT